MSLEAEPVKSEVGELGSGWTPGYWIAENLKKPELLSQSMVAAALRVAKTYSGLHLSEK